MKIRWNDEWVDLRGVPEVFVEDPEDPGNYVTSKIYVGETDPAVGGDVPYVWLQPSALSAPPTPSIKTVTRQALANIDTTSTTRTPVDSTNFAYQTFNLAVGDLVKCSFVACVSNSTSGWGVMFDFEVDQPTSANTYVAVNNDWGVSAQQLSGADFRAISHVSAEFVATEAGSHGFRPVWFVEGNRGRIWLDGTGSNGFCLATFEVQHWPGELVL